MKMSDRPLDGVAENPLEKYPQVAAGNAGRTGRAIDTLLLCGWGAVSGQILSDKDFGPSN